MSVAAPPLFDFDDSYVRELPELSRPWQATSAPSPELIALNEQLAIEVGLDIAALRAPSGVSTLVGNDATEGSTPVAQAYSGHQFGGFSPTLGDGRALLLGEVLDADGRRRDIHLKGSGRTPFARGGDGKAVLGPMLREYLFGEAMHALGVPTTRALSVVGTGEQVARERWLPGAVLARVAASHLRVGTFQYAAAHHGPELVRRLADYSIGRHDPGADETAQPYLEFLRGVVERQAELVARWMHVGFIHGVLNTDNVTISGETIDYGPCAFMDEYDPATVFSSIDHGGRYAYGNQPQIMQWNLARLAETLLPLLDDDGDAAVGLATGVLDEFPDRYRAHWRAGMHAKLGLDDQAESGDELIDGLLALLQAQRVDFTNTFRSLASVLRGDTGRARALFSEPEAFDDWSGRWSAKVQARHLPLDEVASAMDAVNPLYIPRNHNVEHALGAATDGDIEPFGRLLDVLAEPFTERPGLDEFTTPAPPDFGRYRTFCGT